MNILIANVRNIRHNEIKTLAMALNKKHTVTIASMALGSSHKGQSFSLGGNPVRVNTLVYKEVIKNSDKRGGDAAAVSSKFDGITAYEFFGAPADAVSIMLGEIMAHNRPDIVICGINNNIHMGQDIYCSSNIGMAMESTFFGVPAISVGIERQVGGHSEIGCANAVRFIEKNIESIAKMKLPKHTFLNINIPTVEEYADLRGVKVTRLSWLNLINEFVECTDPKGAKYYWSKNVERRGESPDGTGIHAFERGYVSVTPISYDATDYEELRRMEAIGDR
jgi:5'-nucleotidase